MHHTVASDKDKKKSAYVRKSILNFISQLLRVTAQKKDKRNLTLSNLWKEEGHLVDICHDICKFRTC